MEILFSMIVHAKNKEDLLSILDRMIERVKKEPDDGSGLWKYSFTNIPKDEETN